MMLEHLKGAQSWDFLVLVLCNNQTEIGQIKRLLSDFDFFKKSARYSEIRSLCLLRIAYFSYAYCSYALAQYKHIVNMEIKYIMNKMWRPVYVPGWWSNQLALYPSPLIHGVQSLYISCYVLSNKLVLSYLLSCLLPQKYIYCHKYRTRHIRILYLQKYRFYLTDHCSACG